MRIRNTKILFCDSPVVLNLKIDRIPPDSVYIGRGSKWGNPFIIGKDGTRKEVIKKYLLFLQNDARLMSDIKELKGKTLHCFCKPKECHGDILLYYANLDKENEIM